jgi:serine kinase of HPr protein (carbohydrate metabolism regulator)
MLAGPSGAGKSSLSFACARRGWTFLSDDCTWLLPGEGGRIALGRPRHARFRLDAPRLFPELEGCIGGTRPNGKISIEVPTSAFPEIRTADRTEIRCVVLLDRRPGGAELRPVGTDEAAAQLLRDMPSYGEDVNAMHERAVVHIAAAGAFRLRYESLDDAVAVLTNLPGSS